MGGGALWGHGGEGGERGKRSQETGSSLGARLGLVGSAAVGRETEAVGTRAAGCFALLGDIAGGEGLPADKAKGWGS